MMIRLPSRDDIAQLRRTALSSPDGEAFFLIGKDVGMRLGLVARCSDAGTILVLEVVTSPLPGLHGERWYGMLESLGLRESFQEGATLVHEKVVSVLEIPTLVDQLKELAEKEHVFQAVR
jgi:hypothetical protein